jgi:hypothetical protein
MVGTTFHTVVSLAMDLHMGGLGMADSILVHPVTMVAFPTEDPEVWQEVRHPEVFLVEATVDFPTEDPEVQEATHHPEVETRSDPTEDPEVQEATHHPEVEIHMEARTVVPEDISHRAILEVEVGPLLVVDSQLPLVQVSQMMTRHLHANQTSRRTPTTSALKTGQFGFVWFEGYFIHTGYRKSWT